ncbi:MAG: hypothetical protein WCY43_01685 [Patescibacteria group bacterium]|nr:hypothetical protein [Patescibacteria group bacterium]
MIKFENISSSQESVQKNEIHGADKAIFQKIKSLIDSKSNFNIFTKDNKIDFDKISVDLVATFESCQYPNFNNIAYKLEGYMDSIEDKQDLVLKEEEKQEVLQDIYNIILEEFYKIQN